MSNRKVPPSHSTTIVTMAKGTVDWNSPETWQRAVAAILATGVKVSV